MSIFLVPCLDKKITCDCEDGGTDPSSGEDSSGGGSGPEPEVYVDFFDEFFSVDDPWDNFYVQFYVTSGTRPEAEVT
jgi:hypothetical protein